MNSSSQIKKFILDNLTRHQKDIIYTDSGISNPLQICCERKTCDEWEGEGNLCENSTLISNKLGYSEEECCWGMCGDWNTRQTKINLSVKFPTAPEEFIDTIIERFSETGITIDNIYQVITSFIEQAHLPINLSLDETNLMINNQEIPQGLMDIIPCEENKIMIGERQGNSKDECCFDRNNTCLSKTWECPENTYINIDRIDEICSNEESSCSESDSNCSVSESGCPESEENIERELSQISAALRLARDKAFNRDSRPISWRDQLFSPDSGQTFYQLIFIQGKQNFGLDLPNSLIVNTLNKVIKNNEHPFKEDVQIRLTGQIALEHGEIVNAMESAKLSGSIAVIILLFVLVWGIRSPHLIAAIYISMFIGFNQ